MKVLKRLKMKLVIWVWKQTPNCVEMSRLASMSIDRPLPFTVRFKMQLHQVICVWCKRYQQQLRFLRKAAPRMQREIEHTAQRGLSEAAKRRIHSQLRKEIHRGSDSTPTPH